MRKTLVCQILQLRLRGVEGGGAGAGGEARQEESYFCQERREHCLHYICWRLANLACRMCLTEKRSSAVKSAPFDRRGRSQNRWVNNFSHSHYRKDGDSVCSSWDRKTFGINVTLAALSNGGELNDDVLSTSLLHQIPSLTLTNYQKICLQEETVENCLLRRTQNIDIW